MHIDHSMLKIFKQKKLKNFSITDDAIKQMLFLLNLKKEHQGIKLSVKKSGCAGFKYQMNLVQLEELKKKENRNINFFIYKNIYLYFDCKEISFFEGITIDFVKNNFNQIFKFHTLKFKKFCGCGESFSIN